MTVHLIISVALTLTVHLIFGVGDGVKNRPQPPSIPNRRSGQGRGGPGLVRVRGPWGQVLARVGFCSDARAA